MILSGRLRVMKTDLLLIPMSARWADMRAAALAAEDAGFDGLWTWDHLRDPDGDGGPGVPEAWTVLTALAEVTRRVSLGPLVLNVANRQPGRRRFRRSRAVDCSSGSAPAEIAARRTPSSRLCWGRRSSATRRALGASSKRSR